MGTIPDVDVLFLVVGLAITVLVGTALSSRLRVPAPMVLLALGIIGSFLPFLPTVELSPEMVLFGLLPPLLYTTALQTSILDIRANLVSVLSLSVALVVVTTLGVAAVVMQLLPDIGWPVAIALGAVVAPPDAVSASAVARRIGLPRQIVTVLEGESLLNDATALVSLRTAIAAIAGTVAAAQIAEDFAIAAGGGGLIGLLVAVIVLRVRRHVRDPLIDTGISLVIPFAAYLVAEEIEASGVIAVVVAGLLIGHKAPIVQTSSSRITERVTWNAIAYLLEHAVFLLIGLQAARIIAGLEDTASALDALGFCLAVLAAVIVIRVLWVSIVTAVQNLVVRPADRLPFSSALVISWAGMRGVVTIAAVFVIPADVPHHDLLVLASLTVVLGTLYLQGLSLPWLTRVLRVPPQDPAADALARASLLHKAGEAGLVELRACEQDAPEEVCADIRTRVEQRDFAAWERLSTTEGEESPSEAYTRVRRRMLTAERAKVLEIRSEGEVPSQVVREVLAMLDVEESMLDEGDVHEETRPQMIGTGLGEGGTCPDLREHPAVPPADADEGLVCAQCVEDGTRWVALRRCLECGHIGCCDSSPGRHGTRHFHDTEHPVMQSCEPGETWRWCFVHRVTA